ncbi:MAG: hypothetical protein RL033_7165 [Pseudomonadota bacterium]
MTQPCAFGTHWRRSTLWLLGSALALACGSTDDGKLLQPFRVSSGDAEGSAAGSDGSGGNGSAGNGSGGSDGSGEQGDAGGDAAPDAASQESSCRIGSLEDYCAAGFACPDSPAAARTTLQDPIFRLAPVIIVQRACSAANGAARVSVSASYRSLAMNYIYDGQTRQLVGVQVVDDVSCTVQGLNPEGFGQYPGYYGEESLDCGASLSPFVIPAACNLPDDWLSRDAGAPATASTDAGVDAGSLNSDPYECILVP